MPGDLPDKADCSQCVKVLDNCCSVRGICSGVPPTTDIVDTVGCLHLSLRGSMNQSCSRVAGLDLG